MQNEIETANGISLQEKKYQLQNKFNSWKEKSAEIVQRWRANSEHFLRDFLGTFHVQNVDVVSDFECTKQLAQISLRPASYALSCRAVRRHNPTTAHIHRPCR